MNIIMACELCDTNDSKRREDDIHVCDKCNELYPYNISEREVSLPVEDWGTDLRSEIGE